jgi:hypothetical protein
MNATRYARDITVVALLAEHQIIDLEFRHRRDGWVNSDFKIEGDFSDEGYPDIKFSCVVHFIEMPEYNELLAGKEELDEAQGKSDDNVLDAGDRAFGALGMVWSIVKNAIENSIRKADCTVTWMQGKIEQEYTIETFWTDPAGLLQMPQAGGEFTDDDDPSGAGDDGGDSTGGRGGGRGGTAGPRPAFDGPGAGGMMGGRP